MKTTKILVDAKSYIRVFGGGNGIFEEHVRDGDWNEHGYRWEEYEATPKEIKELIDKCVNIKMIEN